MATAVPVVMFSNLSEDTQTGEILVELHDAASGTQSLSLLRGTAGLLAVSILSHLQAGDEPIPETAITQIPVVTRSRPAVSHRGEPCLELQVNHRIPIVLAIARETVEGLKAALATIEELHRQSGRSGPRH
ncbi:hypothetical protein [Rhodospirillaceae bacterium SYSU D60014]|uniref:hypothetical protein n=1 Tax=Virgifigura deserti TaxID=2268457 RepID=UPI000E667EC3